MVFLLINALTVSALAQSEEQEKRINQNMQDISKSTNQLNTEC